MTDRRELIVARLVVLAEGIVSRVFRNNQSITGKAAAAIVVWDGDEAADLGNFGSGRPANAPVMVDMTPELRLLVEAPAAEVGATLNALRIDTVKAVIADTLPGGGLREIIGSNGEVRYEGCSTEMLPGRAMEGSLGVRFAIRYPLIYAEL